MSGPISRRLLQSKLQKKFGFVPVEGSKHDALALIVGGRKVATTRFSRRLRSEDLGAPILGAIARQIRLPPGGLATLRGMVECSVNLEAYRRELEDGGYLS